MAMDEFARAGKQGVPENWGRRLIIAVLYPFALIAAPTFLLALQIFFVTTAFMDGGLGPGIRSLASVLIPLMVLTFLIQPERAGRARRKPQPRDRAMRRYRFIPVSWQTAWREKEALRQAVAFAGSLAAGAAVMSTLQLSTTAPIGEFVASGAFSVLVGSLVRLDKERYITYFFGFILGVLTFITLLGGNL